MKTAEYLFCPLRRKVALNIRDNQNQNAQEHHNFDGIIDKEQDTAADFAGCV